MEALVLPLSLIIIPPAASSRPARHRAASLDDE